MSGESGRRPPSSAGRTLDLELQRRYDDDQAERRVWGLGLLVASLVHVAALAVPVPIAAASDEPASVARHPPLVYRLQSVKFKLPSPRRFWRPRTIVDVIPDAPAAQTSESPGGCPAVARAGLDVPVPELLVRVAPVYPEPNRCVRLTGTLIVELLVGLEGEVADTTVLRGLPVGLTEAALDAVRQWRFAPSTIDGNPVCVRWVISIHIRLE